MPEVRLIDENALMKRVCENECGPHFNIDLCDLEDDSTDTRCVFRESVRSEPTAEAEPVRHGRWIFAGEETMHDGWTYRKHKCTECDFVTVDAKNYCPHCGAKMDGG